MSEIDTILVCDRNPQRLAETQCLLANQYQTIAVQAISDASDQLKRQPVSALLVRGSRPISEDLALCRAMYHRHPEMKIVLATDGTDDDRDLLITAFNESYLFRCLLEPVPPTALLGALHDAVRRYEMERIQNLLIQQATEIDRQIHSLPYWLYRLRRSLLTALRLIAGSAGLCAAAGVILLLAGVGALLLLYYLKCLLGIDLFDDVHLRELIFPSCVT